MTSGRLSDSAERLERSAYVLQADAGRSADRGYERDAEEFAEEARDFRQVIEDSDADEHDAHDAFRELSRRYHALRDEVERSDSEAAQRDLQRVTEAYLDVERDLRSSERYRTARDD